MSWHRRIRSALSSPAGNACLRAALGPLRNALPSGVRARLPFRGEVEVQLPDGSRLHLDSDGRDWIVARLYWNGPHSFEPETTAVFDGLIPHADCFFDVGAYSGWYALRAAAAPHRPAVHAFEAVPVTHRRLLANAERNGLANLRAVWAAVGATEEEVQLHVPRVADLPTSASTVSGFRPGTETIPVPGLTLDAYCAREDVALPDLIKIDVEGAEPAVLEGAWATIDRGRPFIFCEVLAGLYEPALQEYFAPRDYLAFHLLADGPREVKVIQGDPTYRALNYLLVPKERRGIAGL